MTSSQLRFEPHSGFPDLGSPYSPLRQTSYDWTSVDQVAIPAITHSQQNGYPFSAPQSPKEVSKPIGHVEEAQPVAKEELGPRKSERKRKIVEPYLVVLEQRKSARDSRKKLLLEPEADSDSSVPLTKQEKNRLSAQRYRQKKRDREAKLENENAELKAKVEKLSAVLAKTQAQLAAALSENASLKRDVDLLV